MDDDEKIKQCKIRIAGYLAEEILLKSKSSKLLNKDELTSQQKDKRKALEIIKSMLCDSFEEDYMSKKMKQELKEKIYETFKQYEQEVKNILVQNSSLLAKIAKALEDKEILTYSDLKSLMTDIE